MQRLKALLVAAIVAGTVAGVGRVAQAVPVPTWPAEGCVAVYPRSCTYVAKVWGGVTAAGGPWLVEVRRGERKIYYFGLVTAKGGVIQPGDHVRAWAGLDVGASCLLAVPIPHAWAAVVRVGPTSSEPIP